MSVPPWHIWVLSKPVLKPKSKSDTDLYEEEYRDIFSPELVSLFLVMLCSYPLPSPLLGCSFLSVRLIGSVPSVSFSPLLTESVVSFSARHTWSSLWSQPAWSSSIIPCLFYKFTLWNSLTKLYTLLSCNVSLFCLFSWPIRLLTSTRPPTHDDYSMNGSHKAAHYVTYIPAS